MMSMKGDGKPVSFIEDCAVGLDDLAEYTSALNDVFERHGTKGTWYAHASVGCLHVRPVLNMKDPADIRTMRAVAEECFALVRAYKGSHSGEHGDGIVRSEFHEPMFGARIVRAFEAVKDAFDPVLPGRGALLNPGRVVRAAVPEEAEEAEDNSSFTATEERSGRAKLDRLALSHDFIQTKRGAIHRALFFCRILLPPRKRLKATLGILYAVGIYTRELFVRSWLQLVTQHSHSFTHAALM